MRIDCNVLFNDEEADKLGTEPKDLWEECCLDSKYVIHFERPYFNGEIRSDVTEVRFISGSVLFVNIPFEDFKKIMKDAGFGS